MAFCWLLSARTGALAQALGNATGMNPSPDVPISWEPVVPAQGDVLRLRADLPAGMQVNRGALAGRPVYFVCPRCPGEGWTALTGVDAEQEPGRLDLSLWIQAEGVGPAFVVERQVPLQPRAFGKEDLTLPDSTVRLSDESMARVQREKEEIDALWSQDSPARRWDGAFLLPVEGRPGSPFGLRRWINGEPRSFHTGVDIKAPAGTPVQASNGGRVVRVGDFFFGGRSVFVDHGLGLYTMYFHLSEVLVEPGRDVRKGDVLGRVGSTGRATGPHLHWGVRLGGARVDPEALLRATQEPAALEVLHEGEDEEDGEKGTLF